MSYSCDEHYDVYDETRIERARKPHRCDACQEEIPKGADYTRIFILYDGSKRSLKRCARCQKIHEHLRELCHERADGEMWPDEELNCGYSYQDHWEEDPPEWLAGLAFWKPGDPMPATERCEYPYRYDAPRGCLQRRGSLDRMRWHGARCDLRKGNPSHTTPATAGSTPRE